VLQLVTMIKAATAAGKGTKGPFKEKKNVGKKELVLPVEFQDEQHEIETRKQYAFPRSFNSFNSFTNLI
jgi:hypothetical protein